MNRQTAHLEFAAVWEDADLQEVVVSVRSKNFSGKTSLYVASGELSSLADHLRGFPRSRDDQREFVLGHLIFQATAKFEECCTAATRRVTLASISRCDAHLPSQATVRSHVRFFSKLFLRTSIASWASYAASRKVSRPHWKMRLNPLLQRPATPPAERER